MCIGVRGKTRNRKVSTGLYLLKGIYRSILSLIGLGNSWQLNIAPQGLIGHERVIIIGVSLGFSHERVIFSWYISYFGLETIGHTICNIRNLCYIVLDSKKEAAICYC